MTSRLQDVHGCKEIHFPEKSQHEQEGHRDGNRTNKEGTARRSKMSCK